MENRGRKAVDVLHVTQAGKQLDEMAQARLKRDLETTLEESYEAD